LKNIKSLEVKNESNLQNIKSLEVKFQNVQNENIALKNLNATLEEQVSTLVKEVNELKLSVTALKGAVESISLREAIRVFEHYVAIDIIGSKSAVKKEKIYTLKQLHKQYKPELLKKVTEEEVATALYLKEGGGNIVHKMIPPRNQMLEILDNLEEPDQTAAKSMIKKLAKYCEDSNVAFGVDPL